MEQSVQTNSCPQLTPFLPQIDVGAIARIVATKTASVDIPAQLLFLPGQYLLISRVDSAVTYKFLSPEAVTAAFNNEPIDSGWLSNKTVRWGHDHQGEWTVQFYPPERYQFILSNLGVETAAISVPMPAFVFGVFLANGQKTTLSLKSLSSKHFAHSFSRRFMMMPYITKLMK